MQQFVAGHLGALIMGLLPAGLLGMLMWRLWPALWFPVFGATLLSWTLTCAGEVARNYHTRDIDAVSLSEEAKRLEFSWSDLKERDRVAWLNFIQSGIVILMSCFVIVSLLAGFAGLLWLPFRWRIFVVGQAFGFIVAMIAIFGGRK